MVEYADYYAVGSDLIFHKTYVAECRQAAQSRLSFRGTIAPEYQQMYLQVNCFDTANDTYVENAVKAWNGIGNCNLNFQTSLNFNSNDDRLYLVSVNISQFSSYSDLLTVIDPPLTDRPATALWINPDHALWSQISSDQKKYLLMHALGHVIGLKDESGDDGFSSSSIMLSHHKLSQNKNLWSGFSIFDQNDLRTKYPPISDPKIEFGCKPQPDGPDGNWMKLGTTYTITANYTNPAIHNPEYAFRISRKDQHAVCELTPFGKDGCNLSFTGYGECEVTTDIKKDGKVVNSYTNTYYGVVDKFTYPTDPQLGQTYEFKWEYWTPQTQESELVITNVSQQYFQGKPPVEYKPVDGEKNRVSIRFDDYGSYTVSAELRAGGRKIAGKTYNFTKMYRPSYRLNVDKYISGTFELPTSPTTEKTGHQPLVTMECSVDFNKDPQSDGRLLCYVNWQYIQNTLLFRRVDHRLIDGEPVKLTLDKGASHYRLPDRYQMYHPDSINYTGHTTLVYQYYTDVSYPGTDGVRVQ